MINVTRLRETLARIESDPTRHSQRTWGVVADDGRLTMCFAGHAATLAGDPPEFSEFGLALRTGAGRDIGAVAAEWLGLDARNYARLFVLADDLDAVRRVVAELISEAERDAERAEPLPVA